MRPDDLNRLLLARPFAPFRLVLTDGATYDIRDPDLMIVDRFTAQLGHPAANLPASLTDREVIIALLHIIRLEPIEPRTPTPAAANP